MIRGGLEYLGQRLDAVQSAASKGAHTEVDRFAAARFITGTYFQLDDILRLRRPSKPALRPMHSAAQAAFVAEATPEADGNGTLGWWPNTVSRRNGSVAGPDLPARRPARPTASAGRRAAGQGPG